ncbi:2,3-bisphosphoglycerate-dependent phosphoglycerate mutase [Cryobacterium sp. HLT2-28]|uniref:2,3-bisphosphoglycerate-dependent phosphoglycerate mutase n=1 Tax=Cryobacterium sp. HLT2-28 TaxID=1259146 RepID=UPI00106AA3C9|nr:2,3-bisphosphoglycerate-dependent phosphoglycerate mutase [Cryobacterium sp. HLT2-28]TFB98947.1 2,3-bisphosphoglycerate-dependent phosphoglycerate mutase [Cryobacterium sp. HLT2-28]
MRDAGILVLLRHGESTANAAGLFTGVLDVPLSVRGIHEAQSAAALLAAAGLAPQSVFSSELHRARQTAEIVTGELPSRPEVLAADWRVNERNYGALTGRSKEDVRAEFGQEQFLAWRRSVHTAPPPLGDSAFAALRESALFRRLPAEALTRTESLSEVMTRVVAFHAERIEPRLTAGQVVLVVAHGNSLRAYCAVLDALDDHAIHRLNLPTGHPLVYRFGDAPALRPPGGRYLDAVGAHAAAITLAREGGT